MDFDDWNELCNCAGCGRVVSPPIDRTYAVTPEAVLCWDCAIQHGGSYDVETDRWVVAPAVADFGEQWRQAHA